MRDPLLVLSVRIESAICSRGGEILTHSRPIKLHEFQECFPLLAVVETKTHTEQCCFSLHETFPKFLPVGSRKPSAVQLERLKMKSTFAYDRQNANLRTKCPMWSFRLCSSNSDPLAVLLLSGTYFVH